jgi:hypothetical protein
MDKSKKVERDANPRRQRDRAHERPTKRRHYAAGADGEQDVNAGPTEDDDTFRPDRDGSGW